VTKLESINMTLMIKAAVNRSLRVFLTRPLGGVPRRELYSLSSVVSSK